MSKLVPRSSRKNVKSRPAVTLLEPRAMAGDLFHAFMILAMEDLTSQAKLVASHSASDVSDLNAVRATPDQAYGTSTLPYERPSSASIVKNYLGSTSASAVGSTSSFQGSEGTPVF